jgi:hypothetical protein
MNVHTPPEELHDRSFELLPWLVNGRLAPNERAWVEAHVEECDECRREVELQAAIQAGLQGDVRLEHAPQPSLQKLMARIEEIERAAPNDESARPAAAPRGMPFARMPRWLTGVLVAQGAFVMALAVLIGWQTVERSLAPSYQTLTAAEPATAQHGNLRVVLAPDVTLREFGALLASVGARVVAGPSEAGAWTLVIPFTPDSPRFESALRLLRSDQRILLAEPIAAVGVSR